MSKSSHWDNPSIWHKNQEVIENNMGRILKDIEGSSECGVESVNDYYAWFIDLVKWSGVKDTVWNDP